MSTILQATSVLTVTVTGTQIIAGTVFSIKARDTEAGLPLRLAVDFKNTGNVAVTPRIDCQILKGTETVAQFSYNQTEVRAESQEIIPVEWATTIEQVGAYTARVSVLLNDKLLETKELTFNLLPPGTFTKQGELTSLAYDGQPVLNSLIKFLGVFKNTGEADARAKLIAEVFFNGTLIDTAISEETLIPVGENGTLTSYYKLTQKGQYIIRAYATYEGKQTETKDIVVTVTGTTAPPPEETTNGENEQPNQSWKLWVPAIIVIVLAVGVVAYFMFRRSKQPSHSGSGKK